MFYNEYGLLTKCVEDQISGNVMWSRVDKFACVYIWGGSMNQIIRTIFINFIHGMTAINIASVATILSLVCLLYWLYSSIIEEDKYLD